MLGIAMFLVAQASNPSEDQTSSPQNDGERAIHSARDQVSPIIVTHKTLQEWAVFTEIEGDEGSFPRFDFDQGKETARKMVRIDADKLIRNHVKTFGYLDGVYKLGDGGTNLVLDFKTLKSFVVPTIRIHDRPRVDPETIGYIYDRVENSESLGGLKMIVGSPHGVLTQVDLGRVDEETRKTLIEKLAPVFLLPDFRLKKDRPVKTEKRDPERSKLVQPSEVIEEINEALNQDLSVIIPSRCLFEKDKNGNIVRRELTPAKEKKK